MSSGKQRVALYNKLTCIVPLFPEKIYKIRCRKLDKGTLVGQLQPQSQFQPSAVRRTPVNPRNLIHQTSFFYFILNSEN